MTETNTENKSPDKSFFGVITGMVLIFVMANIFPLPMLISPYTYISSDNEIRIKLGLVYLIGSLLAGFLVQSYQTKFPWRKIIAASIILLIIFEVALVPASQIGFYSIANFSLLALLPMWIGSTVCFLIKTRNA